MRKPIRFLISMMLSSLALTAQQPATFQDPLLDHFVGKWVLAGTIGGAATTHDVDVAWVLGHQYVKFREVSREKKADGQPEYEAIVFIGWDQPSGRYACLWLDNSGGSGLTGQSIGYAKRAGEEMAFLFYDGKGVPFHTTFTYDKSTDSWQWKMDGEEGGQLTPFARVKLTRSLK